MPDFELYRTVNLSPLIEAEIRRLRANGCTKSEINIRALAWRKVTGRR